MVLVDSCVWINFLKNKPSDQVGYLEKNLANCEVEFCLSPIIYFEVLRGILSDLDRHKLKKIFNELTFVNYKEEGFDDLINLYHRCKSKGINQPKLGDWLLVKTILDHDMEFLTLDEDFEMIHKIYPLPLLRF